MTMWREPAASFAAASAPNPSRIEHLEPDDFRLKFWAFGLQFALGFAVQGQLNWTFAVSLVASCTKATARTADPPFPIVLSKNEIVLRLSPTLTLGPQAEVEHRLGVAPNWNVDARVEPDPVGGHSLTNVGIEFHSAIASRTA